MGRGVKPSLGGGAGGGQVTAPGSRPQIARERVKVTNKTVGEGLVDTLSGLNDQQIAQFGDVLRSAAREADAGDVRATQTYALALNKLSTQGVDGLVQWKKIVDASGMTPVQFKSYFQELQGPPRANRDVSDAEAVQMAEDAPPPSNAQILPANMPQEGVAPSFYDPSAQLDDAVGGELSAQGMPFVEREGMVSPHSWAHILGSADAAKRTYFDGTSPDADRAAFPQLARYDNIRFLAQQTGLPFQAVVGAPPPKGVVKQAFDMIDAARNPDGSRAVTYDFERKGQMRPMAEKMVAEDVMADEKVPPEMRDKVAGMRVQELLDRMPAGTYPEDLGPRLKELLMAGDQPDPTAPAPAYQGSDFDPVAAQAALDNEAPSLPDDVVYGPTIGGKPWRQELYDQPVDTNLLGSMPTQTTSPLARLVATGSDEVAPAFVTPDTPNALPNLQYEIGLPGYGGRNLADEFAGANANRSPLDRALEEHYAVLRGQAPTPRVVQGLLSRSPNEDMVGLIQQNLGSFYDLDNRMKDWRRGVNFETPGGSMQFPIPPDVLAALYSRQLRIKDPGIMAEMVGPMTVSSDVIGSVKPTGRAGSMLRAGGGYVEPMMYKVGVGGRGGVSAQQAAEIKAMLLESIQMNNRRLKEMGRTPPILFPTKPKNAPPIINMQGASLMPESSRFDNFRVNPLMRLVG